MITLNKPEVSIITITRNRAELISRAIKSVLGQTFNNFEYIIVDGASTDNTAEVVESFKDDRIKFHKLKEDIRPITACIDYAVGFSQGYYITFLDDDDEYLPTKIEKQFNLIKSLPDEYGMVYCWMDYFDNKKGKLLTEHHPAKRGYLYYDSIGEQSMGGTPTLFLKKSVFKDVNGFNKNLKHVADWEFNTRVARKYLIDFVPEVLVNVYVNHPFLRMQVASAAKDKDKINNLIEYSEYYLTEFKDGFQKHPEKKIIHLTKLAKLYGRLGEFNKSKNIIKQLISEFGFSFSFLVTALKSFYFSCFDNVK